MKHSSQRPVLPGLFQVMIQELPTAPFDGATFQPAVDQARLGAQLQRVATVMADGQWRSLSELEAITGDPQASISARIRDLRKIRNGGQDVQHRRRTTGQWEYRIASPGGVGPGEGHVVGGEGD